MLCSFPWYCIVLLPTRQIYRGFVEMPRSATRSRSRARNMGYPPEFFLQHFGEVPYTNRRYRATANAPLTGVGKNLENRERRIRAFGASLQNFNRERARLGYYNMIGETPATRSPRRSPRRSPPRSPTRSASPKGCVGWFCGLFGKGTRRRHR
jgi:hypothetical protein